MKKCVIIGLVCMLFTIFMPVAGFGEDQSKETYGKDVEALLRSLQKDHKMLYDVLLEVQKTHPDEYQELIEELFDYWDDFKILQRENPKLANLEANARAIEIKLELLEDDYHQKKSKEEKLKIENNIKAQLTELFQLKVAQREMEIAELQEELEQLKYEL